jgi:hypothetical protein
MAVGRSGINICHAGILTSLVRKMINSAVWAVESNINIGGWHNLAFKVYCNLFLLIAKFLLNFKQM